ncbi:MAG: alpha/beta fold hydrolase [Acidimicrobiales bacterium]
MPAAPTNGIHLFYEDQGDRQDEPMVLVMGFTAQLTAWPEAFVDGLLGRSFRVVRLDNRDSGLSARLDGVAVNPFEVDPTRVPYLLADMATDVIGLLDHLGIDRAHVVGASMGGMIAQTLALDHPERVRSLCSIMSTTGASDVGQPTAEAVMALLAPPPADREGILARSVEVAAVIGSRTHPGDAVEGRQRAGEAYDRAFYPEGAGRQLAALLARGDRTERLRHLDVPTLVVHGLQDTLIQPDGGRATAAAVPGARLVELADMGHDLPAHLWPLVIDAIEANARRARP